MKKRVKYLTVIVILAAIAGGVFLRFRSNPAAAATHVATATVQRSSLSATVNTAGNIQSHQSVDLSFGQSGTVKKINVKVGDSVKIGDVLAELDTADLNLQLRSAQVVDAKQMDAAIQQISAVLRDRHKIRYEDDFTVRSQQDMLESASQITGVLTLFLGGVAGISLLVGGIGIMNIMLVSVTERTREIGIRKAIGATRKNVLSQFLTEATILSVLQQ